MRLPTQFLTGCAIFLSGYFMGSCQGGSPASPNILEQKIRALEKKEAAMEALSERTERLFAFLQHHKGKASPPSENKTAYLAELWQRLPTETKLELAKHAAALQLQEGYATVKEHVGTMYEDLQQLVIKQLAEGH